MRPLFYLLVVCLALTLTTGLTEQRLRQARSPNFEYIKNETDGGCGRILKNHRLFSPSKYFLQDVYIIRSHPDKVTLDKSLPQSFDEWKDGKTISAAVKDLETPKVVFDWMKQTAEDTAAKLKEFFNKTQMALTNHAANKPKNKV